MKGKLILHIGTEKTGSTTIQKTLASNLKMLRQHGVSYLPMPMSTVLLRAGMTKKRPPAPTVVPIKRSLAHFPVTIASSELFQSRLPEFQQIEFLADVCRSLEPASISVIIYLRRQAEIANSMIATAARTNRDREQSPLSLYVRNICDHKQTLETWSRVFGRECIKVRVFSEGRLFKDDLVDDFLDAMDFPFPEQIERVPSQNEGLSWDGVLVTRSIHKLLERSFPDMVAQDRNRLGAKLCQRNISPVFKNPKLVIHPDIWQLFDEEYAGINDWVKTCWFGDASETPLFRDKIPLDSTSPTLDPAAAEAAARQIIEADASFIEQWEQG